MAKSLWDCSKSLIRWSWQWEGTLAHMHSQPASGTRVRTHTQLHALRKPFSSLFFAFHSNHCTLLPRLSSLLLSPRSRSAQGAGDKILMGPATTPAGKSWGMTGCEVCSQPPPAGISGNQDAVSLSPPWKLLEVLPFCNFQVPQARSEGLLFLYIFS